MSKKVRRAAAGITALMAAPAWAQVAIYSNASFVPYEAGLFTGRLTASGVFAPGTDSWSELQSEGGYANAVAGYSSHLTEGGGFRFADDFTVTGTEGWRIQTVSLFAYQAGATGTFPPIAEVNMRVWDGPPGAPGSQVIFGDAETDRLAGLVRTGVYRVFDSVAIPAPIAPQQDRHIWQADVRMGGLVLPSGTYWLDWQYRASIVGAEIFVPAVTLVGKRSMPEWNARQYNVNEERWVAVIDGGKPSAGPDLAQDFPFILTGWSSCMADFTGDGRADFSDYLTFLNLYDSLDPLADLNADGEVDFGDYLMFLNLYETPCE